MQQGTCVVADVGGTNTRLAIYDPRQDALRHVRHFSNRDFASLAAVIEAWRQTLDEAFPSEARLAIAAPPSDDLITMFNSNWSFSRGELAKHFGFERFSCINDFQANAYALPHLDDKDLHRVHAGGSPANACLATVGPGTGLGGATLQQLGPRRVAIAAEPGHMGLSPASDLELEIFRLLLRRYPDIYAELLVSGEGLARLYRTICQLEDVDAAPFSPAEVSTGALAGSDSQCMRALEVFCALLGSVCGDFLLANGCYGGLYLAGGIVPRIGKFLDNSAFLQRLQSKGAMRSHLCEVPVYVITAEHTGLLGAAHASVQEPQGI